MEISMSHTKCPALCLDFIRYLATSPSLTYMFHNYWFVYIWDHSSWDTSLYILNIFLQLLGYLMNMLGDQVKYIFGTWSPCTLQVMHFFIICHARHCYPKSYYIIYSISVLTCKPICRRSQFITDVTAPGKMSLLV